MRILVVDDREDNCYLLETTLRGNGYAVESAHNGAEALERLNAVPIDLVISDILMPVMDGFELCHRIRSDSKFERTPFIFYTATYTGPQDEDFALKIGADRFLVKPCEPDVLLENVKSVLHAAKRGEPLAKPAPMEEGEVLKLYNQRLVSKLEQNMMKVESEVQARRKTEIFLRESEEKYRSLFCCIRDGILVTDTECQILDANPAFVHLFGYALHELTGRCTEFLHATQEEFHQLVQTLRIYESDASRNHSLPHTMDFRRKDGSVFTGELHISCLHNNDGSMAGYIGLIRNITDRIKSEEMRAELEQQLHQSQKIESLGKLAGGIAHDFNNQLTGIMGYADMIEEEETNARLKKFAQNITALAQRSSDLTKQLLAFARKGAYRSVPVNLHETIHEVMSMLERTIDKRIEIRPNLGAAASTVIGDPSQFQNALLNLALNARDAMPEGGELVFTTAVVELSKADCEAIPFALEPGYYLRIDVTDSGCGMSAETMQHLFEPFFTTKEVGKGTGMGLAAVYGTVNHHKGAITVDSQLGRGTTFRIHLPLAEGCSEHPIAEGAYVLPDIRGTRILLMDDEEPIREMLSIMLTNAGCSVTAFSNGADALAFYRDSWREIDVVFFDMMMPRMGGAEALVAMRGINSDIRAVLSSGYDKSGYISDGAIQGNCTFIQKPFSVTQLTEAIAHVRGNTP